MVESNRPTKAQNLAWNLQPTNATSFNILSIIFLLLSIFQKEKVSIDEKNFEFRSRSRAEKDFNAFGTIVTISQSEHDVAFSARINGPRFRNFQYRSRKVVYIFQFKQDDCWWSIRASTHKQERPKLWLWVVKNIPLTLIILIMVQNSQVNCNQIESKPLNSRPVYITVI